jgi:hypothetical protein
MGSMAGRKWSILVCIDPPFPPSLAELPFVSEKTVLQLVGDEPGSSAATNALAGCGHGS